MLVVAIWLSLDEAFLFPEAPHRSLLASIPSEPSPKTSPFRRPCIDLSGVHKSIRLKHFVVFEGPIFFCRNTSCELNLSLHQRGLKTCNIQNRVDYMP